MGSLFSIASTSDLPSHSAPLAPMPLNSVPWSFSKKLAVSGVALAAALSACEWALRSKGFEHPRGVDRRIVWSESRDAELRRANGLYRFDPICLWSPRPGAEIPWTDGARINPDGFRGPQLALERTPGVLRIATIGGAVTLGVGVRWEDTYSARIVQILEERGIRAEVLCAGAEEHSIVQALERWRHVVRHWRPDVVICTHLGTRSMDQAPQGRPDDQRIAEMRITPRGERASLRDSSKLLHVASWLRDVASGVYWEERDLAFTERRLDAGLSQLDWPGQRRVPYDTYVKFMEQFLEEVRAESAVPVLLSIPRSTHTVDPVAEVYAQGALTVAGWSNTLVIDGRSALAQSVGEESTLSAELFLDDSMLSECGHVALAQGIVSQMHARRMGPR